MKQKDIIVEIMSQIKNKDSEISFRPQCKCLLYKKPEYYQKRYSTGKKNNISRIE